MKHQFLTLDGLRGIAAISVMVFHRREWFGGDAFFGHAFLAVDFFFLLSGFVLAHAYGERFVQREAFLPFVRDRVIRLHPMLIAGSIIALVVAAIEAHVAGTDLRQAPVFWLAQAVPFPVLWGDWPSAFPWNIAIWSLFWELLANLLFAALAPWLTNRLLTAIVATSVVTMIIVSTGHVGFQVGFARDPSQFFLGFPRVCASFFLGVLLYRRHTIRLAGSRILGAVCVAALLLTFVAVPLRSPLSVIYDPVIAYLFYPILLLAAARARPAHVGATTFLAAVSYPLYVIHEPMLRVLGGTLQELGLSNGHPGHFEALLRLCAIVLVAFAVLKLYDEPVRRHISRYVKAC